MTRRHTPGPWVTDCKDHDQPYLNIKIKGGFHNICTVYVDDAPVHDYNAEQYANADLITAAPEMLEAAIATRALVSEAAMTGFNCHDGNWADRLYANQARLSDAIAKAEGRA